MFVLSAALFKQHLERGLGVDTLPRAYDCPLSSTHCLLSPQVSPLAAGHWGWGRHGDFKARAAVHARVCHRVLCRDALASHDAPLHVRVLAIAHMAQRSHSLLGVNEWQAYPPRPDSDDEDENGAVHVVIEPRRLYDVISCLNVLDRYLCVCVYADMWVTAEV